MSRRLARQLRAHAPVQIISSEERKAKATAHTIGAALAIPVVEMPGLEEQGGGQVPFLCDAEAFDRAVERFFAAPDQVVLGGESASEAAERFAAALLEARTSFPSGTLAYVSHGRVLCAFLARHAGVEPYSFWKRLGMPEAMVIDEQGRLLDVLSVPPCP